jgi:hypothetical protein
VYGTTLTFVKVKSVTFKAASTNTTLLTIGNGTNPFVGPFGAGSHTLSIAAGSSIALDAPVSGWTVTAGTGDIIKVANAAGASATYEVMIVGTNA